MTIAQVVAVVGWFLVTLPGVVVIFLALRESHGDSLAVESSSDPLVLLARSNLAISAGHAAIIVLLVFIGILSLISPRMPHVLSTTLGLVDFYSIPVILTVVNGYSLILRKRYLKAVAMNIQRTEEK